MKRDPKQHGCPEQWDTASLIPDQSVRHYLKRYGLGNHLHDILQELQLALQAARNNGIDESGKYAFGILRNIVRKKLQKQAQEREFERSLKDQVKTGWANSRTACPADVAERREQSERLCDIVSKLPWRQKVVLNLRLADKKLTFREIGAVIQMSEATTRADYRKALRFVKRRLNAAEPPELEPIRSSDTFTLPTDRVTSLGGKDL